MTAEDRPPRARAVLAIGPPPTRTVPGDACSEARPGDDRSRVRPWAGLGGALDRVRRPGPRVQRWLLGAAVVAFVAIVAWGLAGYRAAGLEARIDLLVVAALLGTPIALALNAAELRIMADATGVELSPSEAVTATLFASAANALPLPGSALVRGWTLATRGVGLAQVVRIQATAGVTFVAVASTITGGLLAVTSPLVGVPLGLAGFAAVGAALVAGGRRVGGRRTVGRLAVVEAAMVCSELARISVVLAALGLEPAPARSGGLVIANVAAVAIGVLPAGLGLREGLAALTASATDLAPALAVTVTTADRVATSATLAVLVAGAWLAGLRPDRAAEPAAAGPGGPS